jgi:hypothetical protein
MNIVDLIKSQLPDDILSKLGSLIGESEEKTKTAVGAAVPGLLSVLASLASTGGGAERLINSLRQVQQESPDVQGGFGEIIAGGQAPSVKEKGASMINILLGSAALPAILNLLSKFAGISTGSSKGLLSYLAPLVLGMIVKQIGGRGLTPNSLSSFFAEQKDNIAKAMPPGFSLAEIPGLGLASTASRSPSPAGTQEGGMPSWLLPVVGLGLLGLLAWWFMTQNREPVAPNPPGNVVATRPGLAADPASKVIEGAKKIEIAPPDAAKFSTDLGAIYTQLTELLGGVKDVPTAEVAAPKLTDLTPKIDGLKALWDKIPDSAQAAVAKVTTDHLGKLKELVAKVLALPGVGEKLKPILDSLVSKLAGFAVS